MFQNNVFSGWIFLLELKKKEEFHCPVRSIAFHLLLQQQLTMSPVAVRRSSSQELRIANINAGPVFRACESSARCRAPGWNREYATLLTGFISSHLWKNSRATNMIRSFAAVSLGYAFFKNLYNMVQDGYSIKMYLIRSNECRKPEGWRERHSHRPNCQCLREA